GDLARLRFATGSEVPTPWLCLQHDLRERGIDPTKLARVTDATMADNLAALRDKHLDVIQVFEPYASLATRAGIEDHRDAFAAVIRAIVHMQAWLLSHDAKDLTAAVAPLYPDLAR